MPESAHKTRKRQILKSANNTGFLPFPHKLHVVRHGAEDPEDVDDQHSHQNPHRPRGDRSNRRRIRRREHGRYADKARFGCVRGGVAGVESAGNASQKAPAALRRAVPDVHVVPSCPRRGRRPVFCPPRAVTRPARSHPVLLLGHFRMPVFQLHTNVSQDKVTPDLLKQISALVARILHKPESVRASSSSDSGHILHLTNFVQ
ncbi:hypothetical protein Y032_0021g453 [Ancylostoma ceylanicum]|uniref:Uncharacterized protein n=1 Tax=Ancylostoma ceylanicum TaxID=53326 RepID=A0A016UZH2_9BILA|nr:hypothetical protein Y032_0021g453 [Ancylostoma ceylanicum]